MTAPPVPSNEYQLIGLTEDGNAGDLLLSLDQKQGRVRLQALISEWLRMENLGLSLAPTARLPRRITNGRRKQSRSRWLRSLLPGAHRQPISVLVDRRVCRRTFRL